MKNLFREFNKQKYIKEITYCKDKSIKTIYYRQDQYKPKYLVNNNHIFLSGGYRTVLTSDTTKETINPLDLSSAYPVEKFQSAIESKVIKDVFNDLKTDKMDMVKLLLFINVGIGAALLYFQMM